MTAKRHQYDPIASLDTATALKTIDLMESRPYLFQIPLSQIPRLGGPPLTRPDRVFLVSPETSPSIPGSVDTFIITRGYILTALGHPWSTASVCSGLGRRGHPNLRMWLSGILTMGRGGQPGMVGWRQSNLICYISSNYTVYSCFQRLQKV